MTPERGSCQNCGDEVPEEQAVKGSGSMKEDGAERLAEGETVGADELFAFDEVYCSFACLLADGDES